MKLTQHPNASIVRIKNRRIGVIKQAEKSYVISLVSHNPEEIKKIRAAGIEEVDFCIKRDCIMYTIIGISKNSLEALGIAIFSELKRLEEDDGSVTYIHDGKTQ